MGVAAIRITGITASAHASHRLPHGLQKAARGRSNTAGGAGMHMWEGHTGGRQACRVSIYRCRHGRRVAAISGRRGVCGGGGGGGGGGGATTAWGPERVSCAAMGRLQGLPSHQAAPKEPAGDRAGVWPWQNCFALAAVPGPGGLGNDASMTPGAALAALAACRPAGSAAEQRAGVGPREVGGRGGGRLSRGVVEALWAGAEALAL